MRSAILTGTAFGLSVVLSMLAARMDNLAHRKVDNELAMTREYARQADAQEQIVEELKALIHTQAKRTGRAGLKALPSSETNTSFDRDLEEAAIRMDERLSADPETPEEIREQVNADIRRRRAGLQAR